MQTIHPSKPADAWPWSAPDLVLVQARALQAAARAGAASPLLRGKHLGLLCRDAATPPAVLFRDAARELGARVSLVEPSLIDAEALPTLGEIGRVLGRLYDAVECQDLAEALVESLRAPAGVPVFSGIALAGHPSAALAARLEGDPDERRRRVLQAVLIVSLS